MSLQPLSKSFSLSFLAIFFTLFMADSAQARNGIPKNCLDEVYNLAELYNSTSRRLHAGEISESYGRLYLNTTHQSSVNRAKICSEHERIMKERSPLGVYTQLQYFKLSLTLGAERAEELLSFFGLPTQTNLQKKAEAMEASLLSYFDELIFDSHSQLAWEY